jgi:hypothetical protein
MTDAGFAEIFFIENKTVCVRIKLQISLENFLILVEMSDRVSESALDG